MEISFLFEEFDVGEITGFELGDIIIEKGDFQVSSTDRNKVKRKRNAYYISDDKHLIGGIEQRELLNGVYIAAERVWNQYGKYIKSDSVREDFRDAFERYRDAFGQSLV